MCVRVCVYINKVYIYIYIYIYIYCGYNHKVEDNSLNLENGVNGINLFQKFRQIS